MKLLTKSRLMPRAALLAIAVTLLVGSSPVAAAKDCGHDDAYAAETVTDYLDSWRNIYYFYKQFKQCDDGGIAEGVSEAVARLMADHWGTLPQVLPSAHANPAFATWFIGHLDETDNADDLIKVDRLAQRACPADALELCQKIDAQLRSLGCDARVSHSRGCQ